MLALSGRPPKPRPARHAAFAAAVLIAVGIGCLALSERDRPPLIVAGIVTTILGCLLLGPLAIRVFAGLAGRVSIAAALGAARPRPLSGPFRRCARGRHPRARHRGDGRHHRVGEETQGSATEPPNLSDRQIRVYTGPPELREPVRSDTRPARTPGRRRPAARRPTRRRDGDPAPQGLEPGEPALVVGDARVRPTIEPRGGRRSGRAEVATAPNAQLYVATPAVLSYVGIDPEAVDPGTDFLADPSAPIDELVIPSLREERRRLRLHERPEDRDRQAPFGSACGRPSRRCSSRSTGFAAAAGRRSRGAGSSSRAGP